MKKTIVRSAAVAAALGAGVLAAAPAQANSFTTYFRHGAVTYSDGGDKICVHGANGYSASVTARPVNGVGPTVSVTDRAGGSYWTCSTRLMYAYEDTRYSWRASSWNTDIIGGAASGRFWS